MSSRIPFRVRFGWGLNGLRATANGVDVAVIVDVLSFTTSVDVALSRGATVFACRYQNDGRDKALAEANDALLAGPRGRGFSLSPVSLQALPEGARIVLPSPNGSTLSLESPAFHTVCACLRNAASVARWIREQKLQRIAVIACGEHWHDDTLRPGMEDFVGAGAVIDELGDDISPQARAARAAFRDLRNDMPGALAGCTSGLELIHRGFPDDVALSAEVNVSDTVPVFSGDAYTNAGSR